MKYQRFTMATERATDRGRTDDRLFRESPQAGAPSGKYGSANHLGAQESAGLPPIGRESGNEVATQDRTPAARGACRHEVPAWVYETDTKHPRAYGQCQHCRNYVVVLLPPQMGGWNSYSYESPDWLIDEAKACPTTAVVDAVESWLKSPGVCQRVHEVFSATPQEFPEIVVHRLRREFADRYRHELEPARAVQEQVARFEAERAALLRETGRLENRLASLRRQVRKLAVQSVEANRAHGVPVLAMEQSAPTYVYALAATDSPTQYRYIGSTDAPQHRLNQHLSDKAAPRVRAWVAEVHARRASVVMLELWKGADRQQGYDVEAALIADYTALGMADLNSTNIKSRGAA